MQVSEHAKKLKFCRYVHLTNFNLICVSQPIRIGPLLTDSLEQIKETLGQLLTGLPRFHLFFGE